MGNKPNKVETEIPVYIPPTINKNYDYGRTSEQIMIDRLLVEKLIKKEHRCIEISEEYPFHITWCESPDQCTKISREEYSNYEEYLMLKKLNF